MSQFSEADPSMRHLPAQSRLFYELTQSAMDFLQQCKDQLSDQEVSPENWFEPNNVINRNPQSVPTEFFGADAASIFQISVDAIGSMGGYSSATQMDIHLFNDGSPYVLEEDEKLLDGDDIGWNTYTVICFPEHEPILINSNEFDKATAEITKRKVALEVEYPECIATAEEFLLHLQEHNTQPRVIDEANSAQLLKLLQTGVFKPDFGDFTRSCLLYREA